MATKLSPFIANYDRKLRMGANIRRKGKVEKVTVCREDEKSSRRSWSSIKKSTRRDEATS